jgi:Fe-S cluster assembly protein SufD
MAANKVLLVDDDQGIIEVLKLYFEKEGYQVSTCMQGDKAVGAFAGRVLVEHGAQQTTSQMTNQNLTATKEARMYTQPMLEIYADDVKCAHGSTVGQLNDAALFYMRQRGIPLKEAKVLLQNAFINEVIDHMQLEPLRDRLHYLVEKRFRGELNKCTGCKLCK